MEIAKKDFNKLEEKFTNVKFIINVKNGYIDGVEAGKQEQLQEGFNSGFCIGRSTGKTVGKIEGYIKLYKHFNTFNEHDEDFLELETTEEEFIQKLTSKTIFIDKFKNLENSDNKEITKNHLLDKLYLIESKIN